MVTTRKTMVLHLIPLLLLAVHAVATRRTVSSVTDRRRRTASLSAARQERYRFALLNGYDKFPSVLFRSIKRGWLDACAKHSDTVDCFFCTNETASRDSCTADRQQFTQENYRDLDGIALQAGCAGDEELTKRFHVQSIPAVTIDQDLTNTSHRLTFIGTHPETLGQTMAQLLRQLVPDGGTYALVGHLPGRDTGFIQEIEKDNSRSNKPHWHAIVENVTQYTLSSSSDDSSIYGPSETFPGGFIGVMERAAAYKPSAIIMLRQAPMRDPQYRDFVTHTAKPHNIALIGTDGDDFQLDFLSTRFVDGLVGQLPHTWGYQALETLLHSAQQKAGATTNTILSSTMLVDPLRSDMVAYNIIPHELPAVQLDPHLLERLAWVGYVFFGIVTVTIALCALWIFRTTSKTTISSSSQAAAGIPTNSSTSTWSSMQLLSGVWILSATMIPLGLADSLGPINSTTWSTGVCMSIPWLALTGFGITLASLWTYTWCAVDTMRQATNTTEDAGSSASQDNSKPQEQNPPHNHSNPSQRISVASPEQAPTISSARHIQQGTSRSVCTRQSQKEYQHKKDHQTASIHKLQPTLTQQAIPVMTLGLGNIIGLTLWTALDPLHYIRQEHEGTDYWNRPLSTFGACRSPDGNAVAYLIPLGTLNLIPLVWASKQAVQARHLTATDIQSVGWAVASLFQAFLTGIPVISVVRDIPEAYYLMMTTMIFLLCMAVLGIIFVPRIQKARRQNRKQENNQISVHLSQQQSASHNPKSLTLADKRPTHLRNLVSSGRSSLSSVSEIRTGDPQLSTDHNTDGLYSVALDSKAEFDNSTPPLYSEALLEEDTMETPAKKTPFHYESALKERTLPGLSTAQQVSKVSELTEEVPLSPSSPIRRQGSFNTSTFMGGFPRPKPLYSDLFSESSQEEGSPNIDSMFESAPDAGSTMQFTADVRNDVKPLYSECTSENSLKEEDGNDGDELPY